MSDDLVARLRDRNAIVMSGLFHAVPTMVEAAAEIERLRSRCEPCKSDFPKLHAEMAKLREQLVKARNIELLRVAIADGFNNGYQEYEDCDAMMRMRFDAAARAVSRLTSAIREGE